MSRAYYPYDTSQPASQLLPMQMPIPEVNFVSGAPLLSPDTINDPDKSCWSASAKKSNAPSKKDMPKHWRNEFPGIPRRIEPLLQIIFAGLCWAVFARIDLQRQWEVLIGPKEKFDKDQTRLAGILNSWLVTVSVDKLFSFSYYSCKSVRPGCFWHRLLRSSLQPLPPTS
jgi:hypothetical protein